MKDEVQNAIAAIRSQFPGSEVTVREDGDGGAYVTIERMKLPLGYLPSESWMGFHITGLYPYADIYPFFISGDVKRADGAAFADPITKDHKFEKRPALQISRRSNAIASNGQSVVAKILKILKFLEEYL